jgi:hypothetical protein
MPRQIRAVRLQTREARQRLAPAKEPYWREIRRRLDVGHYIVSRSRRLQIALHFWSGRAPKNVRRAARYRRGRADRSQSSISFSSTAQLARI